MRRISTVAVERERERVNNLITTEKYLKRNLAQKICILINNNKSAQNTDYISVQGVEA